MESQGQQQSGQGVALKDTRGDVVFVAVKNYCGDDVGIEGVEIRDEAMVGELAKLLGEVQTSTQAKIFGEIEKVD